jgi:outer membrane receptor protein involved in Fe transport
MSTPVLHPPAAAPSRAMLRLAIASTLLACSSLTPPAAYADERLAEASASSQESLAEVEVRGQRLKEVKASEVAVELQSVGNQVQVVTAFDIEAGGYTNMAEIAQGLVRGVNVGYSPDEGEYTIRLDGGGDRDTLVTLDDVPLYDRGPGVEEIWGATLIDPRMIERIEVFRGGQSLYFGSNAGIGVVNVISKKPDGSRGGEVGFGYGAFNSRELWAQYRFPLTDDGRHSVMVYAGRAATDGPTIFSKASQTDNHLAAGGITDYSNSRDNVGVKYLWKIGTDNELLANLQWTQIDFQDTFPNTTIYGPTTSRMPLANLRWNRTWNEVFRTEVIASYRNPELINTKFVPEVCRIRTGCPRASAPTQIVPWGLWTGRLEPQTQRGVGDEAIPAGFKEWVVTWLNRITPTPSFTGVIGLQSINYKDDSDPRVRIDGKTVSNNALIVDLQYRPSFSPFTSISVAGRLDNEKSFGSETIGKFGVRQGLPGGLYVRANGGTSFSLPRTNELFSNTDTVVGNPNLLPETTRTRNYGVGFERSWGDARLSVELGGFSTDIKNRIETTTGLNPNTRFNNSRVTEIRGLVADFEYQIDRNWFVSASYTRQKAELAGTNVQIDQTPEWFAIGSLRYSSDEDRWHFSLLPRLQGPETVQPPVVGGVPVAGLSVFDYGSWFVMDATAQYWAGDQRQHRLQLRLVNVLDEEYGERGAFGNQFYGSRGVRGELTTRDAGYYYPYIFQGKRRSVFATYSYRF